MFLVECSFSKVFIFLEDGLNLGVCVVEVAKFG